MKKVRLDAISTLTEAEAKAISMLRHKLSEKFHLIKFILYGSKARGDHNPESDVDLLALVEEPKTWDNRSLLSELQTEVLWEVDAPIICMMENYEAWVSEEGVYRPLKDNVERDGVELEIPQ